MLKTFAPSAASSPLPYGEGNASPFSSSISLDLRFRNGNRHGFMYAYLFDVAYDASELIRLTFGGTQVEIRGRNLSDLYEKLLVHGVGYTQESSQAPPLEIDTRPHIETISILKIEE